MNPRAKQIVDTLFAETQWTETFHVLAMRLSPADAQLLPHVEELFYLRVAEQYPKIKMERSIRVVDMRTYEIEVRNVGIRVATEW